MVYKQFHDNITDGATGSTLANKLNISKEMGNDIIDAFYSSYPKLDEYFKSRHEEILRNGHLIIDPFSNRTIYFPTHKKYLATLEEMNRYNELKYRNRMLGLEEPEYPKKVAEEHRIYKGSLQRASQNYPIQSVSANMTKIAMSMFYDWIQKEGLTEDVHIVLALHDEIVIECKEEVAKSVDDKLGFCMEHAGTYFCKSLPMKSDGGPTKVWDH